MLNRLCRAPFNNIVYRPRDPNGHLANATSTLPIANQDLLFNVHHEKCTYTSHIHKHTHTNTTFVGGASQHNYVLCMCQMRDIRGRETTPFDNNIFMPCGTVEHTEVYGRTMRCLGSSRPNCCPSLAPNARRAHPTNAVSQRGSPNYSFPQ